MGLGCRMGVDTLVDAECWSRADCAIATSEEKPDTRYRTQEFSLLTRSLVQTGGLTQHTFVLSPDVGREFACHLIPQPQPALQASETATKPGLRVGIGGYVDLGLRLQDEALGEVGVVVSL